MIKFKILHEYNIIAKKYPKDVSFFQSPDFKDMIFEILINLVHPSPFLLGFEYSVYNSTIQLYINYEVNDILSMLCMIRFYYIVKQFFISTEWSSLKIQRIM